MDAFLRRVVATRDRDQGIADDPRADAEREKWLIEQTKPLRCRGCGNVVINEHIDNPIRATVCGECGGRKRQAQLEREDAARASAAAARAQLLTIAGIQTDQPQGESMSEIRLCSQCKKTRLRSNSTGDVCFGCRTGKNDAGTTAEIVEGGGHA